MNQYDNLYRIVLTDVTGRLLGICLSDVPARYVHVVGDVETDGMATMSDSPHHDGAHTTYARVASAVWYDTQRAALYAQVAA